MQPRPPVCRAPSVTMEFDPFGDVQACCANAFFPLGNVSERTLEQIWRGPRAQLLRDALAVGDLSLGCSVCRHRLDHEGAELPLEAYAGFTPADERGGWPQRLSFSLHNTCNLACVMCGSDRSSRIRSQRAHLPPLPHRYGDAFFEQLPPFLEHCDLVDFVGGEPFLIREHHRVWRLIEELGLRPRCAVTTNGMVWDDRVERVLALLDTDVVVSIDGMSDEVFEQIRVGASRPVVLEHLERFRRYAAERGTYLAVNWTFVRHNWFELAAAVRWAEDEGLPLNVMTVIEREHAVQRMDDAELAEVARVLERQERELLADVVLNRESWARQRAMVEAELALRSAGTSARPLMEPWPVAEVAAALLSGERTDEDDEAIAARRAVGLAELLRFTVDHRRGGGSARQVGHLHLDASGKIVDAALPWAPVGRAPEDLVDVLADREQAWSATTWLADHADDGPEVRATLYFGGEERDKLGTVLRLWAVRRTTGTEVIVLRDDWFVPSAEGEVAVTGIRQASPTTP